MCGILFSEQKNNNNIISADRFYSLLRLQEWRGPDSTKLFISGRFILGHNRLSIIDPVARSDQPMISHCGRYAIIFNGEIYNHKALRKEIPVEFRTESDTETILEGYIHFGELLIERLEGMFSFIIVDFLFETWIMARDRFGIKPLYYFVNEDLFFAGSEASVVAKAVGARYSETSVQEWRILRRPTPGFSYFDNIFELLPGFIYRSDNTQSFFGIKTVSNEIFSQDKFSDLIYNSIVSHQLSDVNNVALLSGGLDSGVVLALSAVSKAYTVGLPENNEFKGAQETSNLLRRELVKTVVSSEELIDTWKFLTRLRGEPLSVPNEALIYRVCLCMLPSEKVVLTGEGADELMFGYDRIYRWGLVGSWSGVNDFLSMYGYSDVDAVPDRFIQYIESLRTGKSLIEFVEDFFYDFHLPGLLRRMDFASMAASKEARVPFVDIKLVNYMYRRNFDVKLSKDFSKIPIRVLAEQLGLHGALNRKKIGFSASADAKSSKYLEYSFFHDVVLKELGWL